MTWPAVILVLGLVSSGTAPAMTSLDGLSPRAVAALKQVRSETERQIARLSLPAERAEAWGRLGMYYQAQHLPSLAEEIYSRAIEEAPDGRWHYLRAIAAGERGELKQSLADFTQAVALAPDYLAAWYRLGMGRLVEGNLPAAKQALGQARRLAPNAAIVLMGLADAASAEADWEQALVLLTRAHELAPQAGQVAYKLAMVHRRLGNIGQAKAWLGRRAGNNATPEIDDPLLLEVAELSQSGRFYMKAGEWAMERGDVEQAAVAFRNATELAPTDAAAGVAYAYALSLQGHDTEAVAEARRLLTVDPDSARVWYTLAWLLRLSELPSELEEAATAIRRSLDIAEQTKTRMLAGALAMKRERFATATADFARLVSAEPEQPYFRFWQGMALLAGADCRGRTHVAQAVQMRPNWGEAHIVLARAEALCQAPEAGQQRARALLRARDDVDTRLTLAMALMSTDRAGALDLAVAELPHPDARMIEDVLTGGAEPPRIFSPGSLWWLPVEIIGTVTMPSR